MYVDFPPNPAGTGTILGKYEYWYEQIIENACAAVEASCVSFGRFLAKAASNLVPIDDGWVYSRLPKVLFSN